MLLLGEQCLSHRKIRGSSEDSRLLQARCESKYSRGNWEQNVAAQPSDYAPSNFLRPWSRAQLSCRKVCAWPSALLGRATVRFGRKTTVTFCRLQPAESYLLRDKIRFFALLFGLFILTVVALTLRCEGMYDSSGISNPEKLLLRSTLNLVSLDRISCRTTNLAQRPVP